MIPHIYGTRSIPTQSVDERSSASAHVTSRVRDPNQDDWNKSVRVMKSLKQTMDNCLMLKADGSKNL